MDIDQFKPEEHYSVEYDKKSNGCAIKLKEKGINLMVEHYKNKYQTNIEVIYTADSDLSLSLDKQNDTFADYIVEYVSRDLKNNKLVSSPITKLYLFETFNQEHATPVLYIKTGDKERIVVADAYLAGNFNVLVARNIMIEVMDDIPNLNVYAINTDSWQRDLYSCHLFGILYARELCQDPTLLEILEGEDHKEAQKNVRVKNINLPQSFLKTAQSRDFFVKIPDNSIVHKNLSLSSFKSRFFEEDINTYPRKKGLKVADDIEIDFYLTELKKLFGDEFTDTLKKEFIQEAKEQFQTQKWEANTKREGLYNFTNKFISKKNILGKRPSP